jgi:uncharacterized protein (TIGR03118 family)
MKDWQRASLYKPGVYSSRPPGLKRIPDNLEVLGGIRMLRHCSIRPLASMVCVAAFVCAAPYLHADEYATVNLVSDVPGLANVTDPNLKNAWGVSFSATSPFWISDQGTGLATLYDGAGNINSTVVTIPGATTGPTGPTGQVFNTPGTGFDIGTAPSRFIFDTKNGTIAGWPGGTTIATTEVNMPGAIYTGLALGTVSGSSFLYAANSSLATGGGIQVFDSGWNNVTATSFAGKFHDPNLPAGYVAYNVQLIGTTLYVTYALLGAGGIPMPGGVVDAYDTSGNLLGTVGSGGFLDGAWGLAIAPPGFGSYTGDLLVGNFGSGDILIYDPTTDTYLGMLDGTNGQPIVEPGLWALATRTGGTNDNTDAVYFTAGPDNQQEGLFGEILPTPEPATIFETATGMLGLLLLRLRRRS